MGLTYQGQATSGKIGIMMALNLCWETFMTFKQFIQTTLAGLAIGFFILMGLGQNSVMAVTLSEIEARPQAQEQIQKESPKLESEVTHYLASIPSNYYTVASIAELKSQLENSQIVLVDVRESSEYFLGHIPNAISIPLRTLADNLDKIPHDRPVVLYCSSGYRSAMGVMTLHLLGYENAQGFPPSFAKWQAAGESISLFSTER